MAAITQGTAEIRLRLNTDDAKRSYRELAAEIRGLNLNIGVNGGIPGMGPGGGGGGMMASAAGAAGGFLGSVMRGAAGTIGGMMAPLFGQVASDMATPASVAGKSLAEQYGFGAMARSANVAQSAADRTLQQLGIAATMMSPEQRSAVYRMNKQMTRMEADAANAVYNDPQIQGDLKDEAAQALVNAAETTANAMMKFANELKKTPGRIKEIGSNLGWW
jgi:hypothetical protein